MNIFYAASTRGFYRTGDNMPLDSVQVETDRFNELIHLQERGYIIAPGDNGYPVAIEVLVDPVESATSQLQYLILQANNYINNKQWPGKAAIGRLKSDELVRYNLWLDYLDALESLDISDAPDIRWPVGPED